MQPYERIPVKTACVSLTSGKAEVIDCEGLQVTMLAQDGDIYIKVSESTPDDSAYVLKSADSITLCGRFVISGSNAKARLLFCSII